MSSRASAIVVFCFLILLAGVGLRVLLDWANHHGPSGDGWTLQGNGALVLLPLWPVVLILGEIAVAYKRAWLAVPLLPVALVLGTVAGGIFGV